VAGTLAVNPASPPTRSWLPPGSPNTPGDGSVAGLIADLSNARSYSAGVAGTDVVGGMDLTTGTDRPADDDRRRHGRGSDLHLQQLTAPNSLTLTGADGSTRRSPSPTWPPAARRSSTSTSWESS
jgi:hypothetical protein